MSLLHKAITLSGACAIGLTLAFAAPAAAEDAKPINFRAVGGAVLGGTWNVGLTGVGKLVNDRYPGSAINVLQGASVSNPLRLEQNAADVTLTQTFNTVAARDGNAPVSSGFPPGLPPQKDDIMVIDFRIRPPYKGFMNLGIVRNWQSVPDDPRKMRPTGFERLPVPSMEHASVDMLVDEMKAAGITKGVLHGRHTGNARYGDVSNAEVNELLLRYPGLFVALAGISPNAPDALEEIEHCVRDWGFKGVALDPGWCSPAMYATDPKIEPILDLCQQLGVFVSITMSAYGGPDLSYCDPTPLVPMLRKFPKVNVVIPHGCWPKVQEAVGAALLCPNLYLAPDCYFFLRNMPMRHEYANAANSFLKYRFLFSTSYPIRGFAQAIEDWKNAGLEPESLQRSLYDNAAELLGISG